MKERRINLIGMRFGKLLVIDRAEDIISSKGKIKPTWKCRCDCGREVIRLGSYLRQSLRDEKELSCMHCNDIKAGDIFGRLTVIEEAQSRKSKAGKQLRYWLCKCSCGNEKEVSQSRLLRGETKSCGCLNIDKTIERNKNRRHHNTYTLINDGVVLGLTRKGEPFYFDSFNLDLISNYSWHTNQAGYLETFVYNGGVRKRIFLHRLITGCPNTNIVDHIDGNPANNRLSNLRIVTASENAMNSRLRSDNTTGFKGVSFHTATNKYQANIFKDGISYYLGLYENAHDAEKAYTEEAKKIFGEYMYDKNRDYKYSDSAQE